MQEHQTTSKYNFKNHQIHILDLVSIEIIGLTGYGHIGRVFPANRSATVLTNQPYINQNNK